MTQIKQKIEELLNRFRRNLDVYKNGAYNETQVRREFIDPFFEALGWDVANKAGYDERNLWFMRSFYIAYPKVNALRSELSWTHYRILLRLEKPDARAFYEQEAINAGWSTRELDRQVNSMLFERIALSRDKAGVMEHCLRGVTVEQKDTYS